MCYMRNLKSAFVCVAVVSTHIDTHEFAEYLSAVETAEQSCLILSNNVIW